MLLLVESGVEENGGGGWRVGIVSWWVDSPLLWSWMKVCELLPEGEEWRWVDGVFWR